MRKWTTTGAEGGSSDRLGGIAQSTCSARQGHSTRNTPQRAAARGGKILGLPNIFSMMGGSVPRPSPHQRSEKPPFGSPAEREPIQKSHVLQRSRVWGAARPAGGVGEAETRIAGLGSVWLYQASGAACPNRTGGSIHTRKLQPELGPSWTVDLPCDACMPSCSGTPRMF